MKIPFKCPVCDGQGLVNKPPYIAGDQPAWTDSSNSPYTCKACGGGGVLWADDGSCEWTEDWEGNWDTACGERFTFGADTPRENGMKFCPYCGKALVEARYVEEVEEDGQL